MNTYKGEGKIISIKHNHQSNLVSFSFEIATSLLAYVATFSRQLYFGRSYFFTLFQSNYFDATVTFSVQLFLQNSCFFFFFRTVTFSQELFFQNSFFFGVKLLQSSHFLRIGSSLWQLLFGTVIFFRGTVQRYLLKQLPLQKRYFLQHTFSETIQSYYFTATVTFHSYTSYLFVSN